MKELIEQLIDRLETVIFGKRSVIHMALTCLLADGHLLLEDVPGTAKTRLAKALARVVGGHFRRIQGTPDLLPGDVTGSMMYNQKTSEFQFHPGPVFAQVLLADEVNRATPRAQAALLEAMAERQVSIDRKTYRLERPFFVIATQNPIEHEGTFALPEAQLDRFMMKLGLGYPNPVAEEKMLELDRLDDPLEELEPVVNLDGVRALQAEIRNIYVHQEIRSYIVRLVSATRESDDLILGAGPRACQGLQRASQALAAAQGRSYVVPDDVKKLIPPILYHRVILAPEGRMNRLTNAQAVSKAVNLVPAPIVEGPPE